MYIDIASLRQNPGIIIAISINLTMKHNRVFINQNASLFAASFKNITSEITNRNESRALVNSVGGEVGEEVCLLFLFHILSPKELW